MRRYAGACARPYDEQALARLLRTGITPDGITLPATMPRYAIDDAQRDDLAAYLRGLSARAPPGLDGERVRVATITTPDVEPQRRDAMLATTLKRFVWHRRTASRATRRTVRCSRNARARW